AQKLIEDVEIEQNLRDHANRRRRLRISCRIQEHKAAINRKESTSTLVQHMKQRG
ncbi:hypothetical protein L9F63_023116, partial [Diploptera punctata]